MATSSSKRILVADDQQIVTRILVALLDRLGFQDVVTVGDGEEALVRLRNEPFDALITDVQMQPMSGLHLVAAIRKDERLSALPIILMTGAIDADLALAAKRLRADAFLLKPFTPQALREQFDRVLARA